MSDMSIEKSNPTYKAGDTCPVFRVAQGSAIDNGQTAKSNRVSPSLLDKAVQLTAQQTFTSINSQARTHEISKLKMGGRQASVGFHELSPLFRSGDLYSRWVNQDWHATQKEIAVERAEKRLRAVRDAMQDRFRERVKLLQAHS